MRKIKYIFKSPVGNKIKMYKIVYDEYRNFTHTFQVTEHVHLTPLGLVIYLRYLTRKGGYNIEVYSE